MRLKTAAALGAGIFLSLAVMPAQAAIIPLGSVTTGTYGGVTTNPTSSSGEYDDFFTFTSSSAFNLAAFTGSTLASGPIGSASFSFYSGVPMDSTADPLLFSLSASSADSLVMVKSLSNGIFAPGAYYFELKGSTSTPGSLTNFAAISVAAVPIPATLPLFGAALLAIGAIGWRKRTGRGDAGTAVAA